MSLPMRERGLKRELGGHDYRHVVSLPMRERGLKQSRIKDEMEKLKVAPHAGAWIETCRFDIQQHAPPSRSPCGSVD